MYVQSTAEKDPSLTNRMYVLGRTARTVRERRTQYKAYTSAAEDLQILKGKPCRVSYRVQSYVLLLPSTSAYAYSGVSTYSVMI